MLYLSYLLRKQGRSWRRSTPSAPGGSLPLCCLMPFSSQCPRSRLSSSLQRMPVSFDHDLFVHDSWTNTSEASYLAEVTGRKPSDVAAFPRHMFILVSLAEFSVPSCWHEGRVPLGRDLPLKASEELELDAGEVQSPETGTIVVEVGPALGLVHRDGRGSSTTGLCCGLSVHNRSSFCVWACFYLMIS